MWVQLTDGSRHEGVLVSQDAELVVIRVGQIERVFKANQVHRVVRIAPVRERYAMLRRNIDDDDVEQLMVLARWLREQGELGLALLETEHVLDLDPEHPEAVPFKRLIEGEIMLEAGRGQGKPKSRPDRRDEFPVLSPEEINLIKVFEVDLRRPPTLELADDLIDRLLERYGDHELAPKTPEGVEALRRWPARRVLELLFRIKARDLYSEVRVVGDPASMARFENDVHGSWLMRGCATSKCHGGTEAGRLALRTKARGSDATVYTNFLILERFRMRDGSPLIDYANPERSILLQMAMPPERSETPHPPLPPEAGYWREPVRGAEDPAYKDTVDWIRSMYTPRPDYPIEYTPPRTLAEEFDLGDPGQTGPR